MPRFYFHTNHGFVPDLQDNEGYTFPDAHTAKGEAVKYAAELLSDVGESFWDPRDFEMTVTDEKGLILFTIRMIGTEAPALQTASPTAG
jgi:hypothetical protein